MINKNAVFTKLMILYSPYVEKLDIKNCVAPVKAEGVILLETFP